MKRLARGGLTLALAFGLIVVQPVVLFGGAGGVESRKNSQSVKVGSTSPRPVAQPEASVYLARLRIRAQGQPGARYAVVVDGRTFATGHFPESGVARLTVSRRASRVGEWKSRVRIIPLE